jgi:SulP family sulfate permease
LIGRIAIAALAGLLMVVGFQTIKFREINKIWRTSARARWLMIATFAATLIVPLQWAIFFGVAASFVAFAYRESETTTVVEMVFHAAGIPIEQPAPAVLPSNKVTLLYAYGSLFFAGARNLEEDLPQADETQHAVVILSLRGHADLGSTFISVLERYARVLQANGNTLMLVGVNPAVYEQLKDAECLKVLAQTQSVYLWPISWAQRPGRPTGKRSNSFKRDRTTLSRND